MTIGVDIAWYTLAIPIMSLIIASHLFVVDMFLLLTVCMLDEVILRCLVR